MYGIQKKRKEKKHENVEGEEEKDIFRNLNFRFTHLNRDILCVCVRLNHCIVDII